MQHAQSAKQIGGLKVDVKQLDLLIQESQLLNERLLKIERLLASSRTVKNAREDTALNSLPRAEGNWPAADVVRDLINSQERQQAYGSWLAEESAGVDEEAFTHRLMQAGPERTSLELQQLLIQKYVPTEADLEIAEISANYGLLRGASEYFKVVDEKIHTDDAREGGGRLMLIAIGIALLLFTLFAGFN